MSLLLVALGAFIASCVQATTGLGFALILTPMLFALMAPTSAITTAITLGLVLNLLVLLAERRRPSIAWPEVLPILATAVPGSACGILLLQTVPKPALQTVIGIAVICATALLRYRGARAPNVARGPAASAWPRLSLGFATGALNTSTGINGPPLALWLSARGLSPGHLRDSLSALFLGMGVIAALALIPVLHRAHPAASQLAVGAIAVLIGHAIGSRVFSRLGSSRFQLAMLTIILATGLASLALGLSAI
jgi:uncharacterized membrane protein YfcA